MRAATFYLIAALVIVTDQLTKWAVMTRLSPEPHWVLGTLVAITPTHNTRSAFSLFAAPPAAFAAIALVAVVALSVAFFRQSRRDLWTSAALALALGGAVGNGIDRGLLGYVRDFFDFRVWPVFNIADSAITIAVLTLAWRVVLRPAPGATGEEASRETTGASQADRP